MTTTSTTLIPEPAPASAPAARPPVDHGTITFARLTRVELVKMFNTRSGVWLMASVGLLALLASGGVLLFGSTDSLTYDNFSAAVGVPMAVILPVLAVLAVTSEYSQRTGLTTFTLVPHRGRVIAAKLAVIVAVGVVAMLVAAGIGALSNLVGAAVSGIDPVWDISIQQMATIILANVIGMLMGFTFGVLLRNSPAAIVTYFVYSLILPNIFGTLAYYQPSFEDVWPWVDFFYSTTSLFEGPPSAEGWAQLATSGAIWLAAPLLVGLRLLGRSEVK